MAAKEGGAVSDLYEGCPNLATHKIWTDYGTYLVCEACLESGHMMPKRSRRRWKNWTQTVAEKQCQCEHIEHVTKGVVRTGILHVAGLVQRRDGDPTDVQFCTRCGQQLAGRVVEREVGWPEGALIEVSAFYWGMHLGAEKPTCRETEKL